MFWAESVAMPLMVPKVALLPVPSAKPLAPPASVETTPPAVILRMAWLPLSATYTLPGLSAATAVGALNKAPVPEMFDPVPLVDPAAPAAPVPGLFPAKVVTTPPVAILRITLLPVSATKMLPEGSIVMPLGLRNWAPVPVPSVNPAVAGEPLPGLLPA